MISPLIFGLIGSRGVVPRFLDAINASSQAKIGAVADVLKPTEAQRRLQELGLGDAPYFQVRAQCQLPPAFWDHIDSVYIAVPNSYHKPYVLAALARGKHVLVEKPIARSPEEAQEIIRATTRRREKVYCTLHYAHYGVSLVLRWFVQTRMKELNFGRCTRVQGAILETDRRFDWRFIPQISGGDILIDTGGHLLSILYYALDAQITVVDAAWDTVLQDRPETEIGGQRRRPATYFELDFDLKGELFSPEATGHISVGKAIPEKLAFKWLRLEFESGDEVVLAFPKRLTVIQDKRSLVFEEGEGDWPVEIFEKPYRNILRKFLDVVHWGVDPMPNLRISLATLEDVFKAYTICHRTNFYKRAEALLAAH